MASSHPDQIADLLRVGELSVEGQLSGASNATLLCRIEIDDDDSPLAVYKPRRGERPLWDFPTGTLGQREYATALVDAELGWHLVPETVWREDGPYGPGMCQRWIDIDEDAPAVDIIRPLDIDPRWKVVLEARTYDGEDVVLAHEDSLELQRLAVLDLLTNNADRKGGHVLREQEGHLRGIDHGLTFHDEPKLRTVLWGWAGDLIDDGIRLDVSRLAQALEDPVGRMHEVRAILSRAEFDAFRSRVDTVVSTGIFPEPRPGDPPLPWPPM